MLKRIVLSFCAAAALAVTAFAASESDQPKKDAKPYPLSTCVVSGDKLGEMGDPYVFQYEGREIKLCCNHCEKDFRADPAKYLKKLDAAATTQPATQPAGPAH